MPVTPLHRRTHPSLDVPGCFGCKATGISFGTVPGARRDQESGVSHLNQREKDLHRYREKRRAGEQPDGTTKEKMDAYDRRVGSWEKAESKLGEENPPEVMSKLRQTTLNNAA